MKSYNMAVSKNENGAYVKQGEVAVFYPELSELGLNIEPSGTDADGFPTYADDRVQYVFDAVLSAVKANARNKLVSGTVQIKDGLKIAETVEELLAAGERSGEALANRREAIKALVTFVPSTGKSAAVQAWVAEQCKNINGVQFQSDARRALLLDLASKFAQSLNADTASKYGRFLTALEEACNASAEIDDLPE